MLERLEELLEKNKISKDELERKLYDTLLLGVFEATCKDIKKAGRKTEEKERFRKTSNKTIATKMLIKKYAGCNLSDEEYETLSLLFNAFFQTGDLRKVFDEQFRQKLIEKQDKKCPVCGRTIRSDDAHLDHIIPWNYVGDLLPDNYQMLCETCNTRKGTSTYFEMSMLLLKYKHSVE